MQLEHHLKDYDNIALIGGGYAKDQEKLLNT